MPQEETVTARLERLTSLAVMRVALVDLSPQEEAELLFASGLPLHGSLVLHFVFEGNDLFDSRDWRTRHAAEVRQPTWQEKTLIHQVIVRLQRLTGTQHKWTSELGRIAGRDYGFLWTRRAFEGLEDEMEIVTRALEGTRERVVAAGGRYAVVLIPTKLRVLGPFCEFEPDAPLARWQADQLGPFPAFLSAWAVSAEIPLLDLTPALTAAAASGTVPWFEMDTHWNAHGHRAAAEALGAWDVVQAGRASREPR